MNHEQIKKMASLVALAMVATGAIFILMSNQKPTIPSQEGKRLSVATSFYPLYFFAKEIAQDKADVKNITPAGAEPHDYEPTAQDIAGIERSDLLILNGDGLEAWGESIRKNIDPSHTTVVIAGEGLATKAAAGEVMDPHIWLSPMLAEKMVDRIMQGFIKADPKNRNAYRSNADRLKAQLADLDIAYKQGLSFCAEKNIITSHASFGYLAEAYGLKQVSITGFSPDAEPSSQQLADIVKFAKDNNVKYIFFESLVSPKLAETIATEVGAQTLVLDPLEGLNSEEIAAGKNYFSVMKDNLVNLETALACNQ